MKRDVPWSSLTRYDALERLCKSKSSCCLVSCRHTKPLTFADCIGDELPLGWEEAYDPQVGAYYVDHNTSKFYIDLYLDRSTSCFFFAYVDVCNNSVVECFMLYYRLSLTESTQLEDPRVQWQREQELMLREYLDVAKEALSAQKEIYQVKEERLRLAQQQYKQLNDAWRDKSSSQTSCKTRPYKRSTFKVIQQPTNSNVIGKTITWLHNCDVTKNRSSLQN